MFCVFLFCFFFLGGGHNNGTACNVHDSGHKQSRILKKNYICIFALGVIGGTGGGVELDFVLLLSL